MANENKYLECRLCLERSEYNFSVFTNNIAEMVESLTCIKLVKSDTLPVTCCETCLETLHIAFALQQRIIECDSILQERLQNKAAKEKDGDENPIDIKSEAENVDGDEDYNNIDTNDKTNSTMENNEVTENESENLTKTLPPSQTLKLGNNVIEIIDLDEDEGKNSSNLNLKSNNEIFGLIVDFNEHFTQRMTQKHKKKDENRIYECERCDIKFENNKSLQAHMSKHKVRVCSICNSSIRSDNFKRHFELHSATTEICEICGKTAKNKESLRGHMFYQHRENAALYKCEHCDREFRYRYKYKLHIRKAHTGVRDHQCEVCGKKFFTAFDTKKHVDMTHMRARPYICAYCSKGFSSRYALKTHVRQHTQETPYRCEICAAGFRQKVSLKTHLKSKHNVVAKTTPSMTEKLPEEQEGPS